MTPLFPTTGDWDTDRAAAQAWAREMLADPDAVILDTETTGLHGAEIVQIGVLSMAGEVLVDSLVRPMCPIPADATAIHGITDAMVKDAPPFGQVALRLRPLLHGRRVIVYNAAFDFEILRGCLERRCVTPGDWYGMLPPPTPRHMADVWMNACRWECAMLPYSAFVGDWSSYRGSYKWQRLPGGDHSAIGDCKSTLWVLNHMAEATPR